MSVEEEYISRRQAVEWLMDLLTPRCTEHPNEFYIMARDNAIEVIRSLPAADVVARSGSEQKCEPEWKAAMLRTFLGGE